ncbi:hypothetical protein CDL15_Pgr022473 [Punica granatum]|uniref:Disease resistance protein Roq1-like winged-helix domain-containing protein n=1 Tax=Punica granatum TaxID=22663 RepID=A0A218XSX6_PUNGR|nr:hypothetical protein CDL15_Pgr022473 [Punica granatum]
MEWGASARQILPRHAFKKESPPYNFHIVSQRAITVTGGLPLALEEEKTKLIYMWQACGFEADWTLEELVDESLVKIVEENRFWLHDQLRDLSRRIVREEMLKGHRKSSSRIWYRDDALKVPQEEEACKELKVSQSRALPRPG